MITAIFEKTTKALGDMGSAHFTIGYVNEVGIDGWHRLLVKNGKTDHDFPETVKTFVLKSQITGAEDGEVELTLKIGSRDAKSIFKYTISEEDAFETQVRYKVVAL